MLHDRGVHIEAKPFSIGLRIEHPQSLIDRAASAPCRPSAPRRRRLQARAPRRNGRSVYSFCMCPGGTVVAATSEPGRVVTNGMSQYSRNERNANTGIVVGITPADYPGDPLAGIALQRHWEDRAFEAGGSNYRGAGAAGRRFPRGPAVDLAWHASSLPTSRACSLPISATACPITPSRRYARRCRPSDGRSRLCDARRGA